MNNLDLGGSLQGVRVLSIEQAVAAPLCSRHMAELGADVIKVEPLHGDFARAFDTFVHGYASHFVWLNHGKRSEPLDLASDAGRQRVLELAKSVDVLITNLAPGKVEHILPIEQLRSENPGLIRVTITGYGRGGPYDTRKAYDSLVQGETGITVNTGTPTQAAKPAVSLADTGAGTYAFGAVMAALFKRERTGEGSEIHISLFDVAADWMMPLLLAEKYGVGVPPPSGLSHASIVPYGAYRTSDGRRVNLAIQNNRQWAALCRDVIDEPEAVLDSRFRLNEDRLQHREEVEDLVTEALARMQSGELLTRLEAADIPWGFLNDVDEVIKHPQLLERNRWRKVTLPNGSEAEVLLPPFLEAPADGIPSVPGLGSEVSA